MVDSFKFKLGDIVQHKVSKEKFVVIKYPITSNTLKFGNYIVQASKGSLTSDNYWFYESELKLADLKGGSDVKRKS